MLNFTIQLNLDITNLDITNLDISNLDIMNLDITNLDITNLDLTNLDITNLDVTNLDITKKFAKQIPPGYKSLSYTTKSKISRKTNALLMNRQ